MYFYASNKQPKIICNTFVKWKGGGQSEMRSGKSSSSQSKNKSTSRNMKKTGRNPIGKLPTVDEESTQKSVKDKKTKRVNRFRCVSGCEDNDLVLCEAGCPNSQTCAHVLASIWQRKNEVILFIACVDADWICTSIE